MLLMSFLYLFAMVTIILAIYALIAYAAPNTLAGRVAAIVRG